MRALEERVLCKWSHFTIWNAGKQGRRLYRSLTPENQVKVCVWGLCGSGGVGGVGEYMHALVVWGMAFVAICGM